MAKMLGARKNAKFKAVCTAPSFNKTPMGNSIPPLPYAVTQDLGSSVGVVSSVRFNRDPAYVLNNSTQPSCKGDAAGSAKGVKSGTTSGEVKPVEGSSSVRVGGQPIIRDGDPCTLNKGNCPGIYTAQPGANGTIQGGAPTADTNPKSGGWGWGWVSSLTHAVLGAASFVPGLSIVTGTLDAALYAAEGNYTEAALAMASTIPGGKLATTAGRLAVKAAQGAQKANAVVNTAQGVAAAAENVASGGPISAAGVVEAVGQVAMGRRGKRPPKGGGAKVKGKKPQPKKKVKCHCATTSEGYKNAKDKQKYLKDYQRQLDMQQENINNMSANEFKAAREAYGKNGRNPLAEGMQKAFGKAFLKKVTKSVKSTLKKKKPNLSSKELDTLATQKAEDIKKGKLVALHNPDMVSGGYNSPMPEKMGDASINSSIGSSWNQKNRIEDMDSYVNDAIKNGAGNDKMNIELKVCKKKDCSE